MGSCENKVGKAAISEAEATVALLTLDEIESYLGEADVQRALKRMLAVARDLERRLGIVLGARGAIITLQAEWKINTDSDLCGIAEPEKEQARIVSRAHKIARDLEAKCREFTSDSAGST